MSVSRRKFIKSGTLTALSAGLFFKAGESAFGQKKKVPDRPILKFQVPYEAQQNPILYYDRAAFVPYVGGTFIARDARGRAVQLTLLRVTEFTPRTTRITTGATRQTETFALTFNASRSLPEFTSIHVIEHSVLGRFDLFLRRSGDTSQIIYEAVINHLN